MSEYIYTRERVSDGVYTAESTGVEIVRCRDCKWCMSYSNATYCDRFASSLPQVEPDGFCAWGERRGGGGMTWFEKHTAYPPMQTTTTTTSWSGLRPMSLRCRTCANYAFAAGIPICYCGSRTVKHGAHGDECVSYREVDDAGA